MKNVYSQCLNEKQLEDYVFGRVSAEALPDVEEHLLVCSDCQDRLQAEEQYVAAFRSAARAVPTHNRWYKPLAAAACLVMAVGLWFPLRESNNQMDTVDLRAERGGAVMPPATLRAGHKAELKVDLVGLESRHVRRLQIVAATGAPVAETAVEEATAVSTWTLGRKLEAGTYWVRAFDKSGKQLREFKLDVE